MIRIRVYDTDGLDTLDKIANFSRISAFEALSKAGARINKLSRIAAKKSQKTDWQKVWVEGRNGRYSKWVKKGSNPFGDRHKKGIFGDKIDPSHISNMIVNTVYEKPMMAVVGGRIKSHRSKRYNDGKITAGTYVKGIGNKMHSMLRKLNNGETDSDYRGFYRKKQPARFANAQYKKRHFMEKGRASAMPYVNNMMGKVLAQLIDRAINRHNKKQGSRVA